MNFLKVSRELQSALLSFGAILCWVFVCFPIPIHLPYLGHLGSGLIVLAFVMVPLWVAKKQGEDIEDYGFRFAPLAKGLGYATISMAIFFSVYAAIDIFGRQWFCGTELAESVKPFLACRRTSMHWPFIDTSLTTGITQAAAAVANQVFGTALPEELMFRGLLLTLLERAWPPKHRFLGGGVGWALIVSSIMFGLIHIPNGGPVHALATFFPGLWFGWLRSATGSLVAPIIAHAGSNLLQVFIATMFS